jgi:sulfatase maturation enzyme AslB (radical SAM superfamily)
LVINKRLEKIELLKDALNKENCVLKITFLSNGTTINDNKIDIIKKNKF